MPKPKTYAFDEQEAAQRAARQAWTSPAINGPAEAPPPFGNQCIFLTPGGGLPKRNGTQLGTADCTPYLLDDSGSLQVFRAGTTVPVWNLADEDIAAGRFVDATWVTHRWIVSDSSADEALVTPWIRFVTTSASVGREITATIELVRGALVNPVTQMPYEPGDAVTLADPSNLWAEAATGATGTAYFREAETDPVVPARWEVETLTLPIDYVEATLDNCLAVTDSTADVSIDTSAANFGYWKLSNYPAVDIPNDFGGSEPVQLTVSSANKEGIAGSRVWIRKISDGDESDPGNTTVPKSGSAVGHSWEVERVETIQARWAVSIVR